MDFKRNLKIIFLFMAFTAHYIVFIAKIIQHLNNPKESIGYVTKTDFNESFLSGPL